MSVMPHWQFSSHKFNNVLCLAIADYCRCMRTRLCEVKLCQNPRDGLRYQKSLCEFENIHRQIFFSKFHENPTSLRAGSWSNFWDRESVELKIESTPPPRMRSDDKYSLNFEGKSAGEYLKIHRTDFEIYWQSKDVADFHNCKANWNTWL